MREELPWLHVQRTRIYYDGGTVRVSFNGNGEASASAAVRSWGSSYYASGMAGFCNGEWRM